MKIIAPWSQQRTPRGYKGTRRKGGKSDGRGALPTLRAKRGSGFWPRTNPLTALTHKSKLFKF